MLRMIWSSVLKRLLALPADSPQEPCAYGFGIDFNEEKAIFLTVTGHLSQFSETSHSPPFKHPSAAKVAVRSCLFAEDLLFNHFMVA